MSETRTLEDGRDWLLQRLETGHPPGRRGRPRGRARGDRRPLGARPRGVDERAGARRPSDSPAAAEAATDPAARARGVAPGLPLRLPRPLPDAEPPPEARVVRAAPARTSSKAARARRPAAGGRHRALRRAATAKASEVALLCARPRRSRAPAGRDDVGRDRHLEGGDAKPAAYLLDLGLRDAARRHARDRPVAGPREPRRRAPVDAGLRLARAQDDLDGDRVAPLGASFGGYWAMKLAYTHRERLRCCRQLGRRRAHHLHAGVAGEVPQRLELPDGSDGGTGAPSSAATTFEDYVARCPELSLLDQGLLDQPSAPLLLVNGRDDLQNATDDIYLGLEHGDPKTARIFPGGHMGEGPTVPTIGDWLAERLAVSRPAALRRRPCCARRRRAGTHR